MVRLGTFGQIATENLYNQKKKQYPDKYTANDFKSQFGQAVHDCVGLIKGYLWRNEQDKIIYNASQDKNVTGMLQNCSENGYVNALPELPGLILFNKNYTHVGIYIGNGEVIEAKGHSYGVVKTKLKDRNWYKWGKLDWLEYKEEKTMSKEEQIKLIQEKAGLDDNTMQYLQFYRYGDALLEKLANAMK